MVAAAGSMDMSIGHVAAGILFLCLRLAAAVKTCDLDALHLAYGQPTSCKTCFIPRVGHNNSLNPADYPKVDLSDNWLYFAGDSTLRQLYGEFYGIIHRSQVRPGAMSAKDVQLPMACLCCAEGPADGGHALLRRL